MQLFPPDFQSLLFYSALVFVGGLIGWFLHLPACRRRIDELSEIWQRRFKTLETERNRARRRAEEAEVQVSEQAKKLHALQNEQAQAAEQRQHQAAVEHTALQAERDKLKQERATLQAEREALDVASQALKQESQALADRIDQYESRSQQPSARQLPEEYAQPDNQAEPVAETATNDTAAADPALDESQNEPERDAVSEADVVSPEIVQPDVILSQEVATPEVVTPEETVSPTSVFLSGDFQEDNLQRIWGIGKKIEALLNEQGIYSFADLADTSVEQLQFWLETSASPQLRRIANEEQWIKQARLAASGDFDGLNAYQDQLREAKRKQSKKSDA